WLAASTANCFCAAKPGQALTITLAPHAVTISRVESVDSESTIKISSAHATDSHAARIFSASLKVMIVAEIFIANCQFPIANFARLIKVSIHGQNRQSAINNRQWFYGFTGLATTTLLIRS